MNNPMMNMAQIMQQLPGFMQQAQAQGITDPRAEVMRRLQSGQIPNQKLQMLQNAAQMLGLKL